MQTEASQSVVPGTRHKCYLCSRTYERHDHLSRHLKSHDNERNYKCSDCGKGFNRADLLNRHRAAHAKTSTDEVFRKRTPRACEACIRAKTKCDDDRPCKRCKTRDLACQKSDGRKSPDQRNRSDTRAEQSFSAETLLPTPAPYTPQLEQLGPHFGMENADSYQLNDDPFASGIADSDFGFPDFFEQIMMPDIGTAGAHEHTSMPLNVADFTQDWTSDALDFDFSFLATGLENPQPGHDDINGLNGRLSAAPMPHSDPQARSEVFKKSPWSWIPERNHGAFKGQDEIDVREHGVHATDQHVSPNVKRPVHCELEQEARDRMIRVVTKVADSRLSIPSFPPLQLLEDLLNVCIVQDGSAVESFLHAPSFNPRGVRTELLLAMICTGSRFVALAPVWKMGLVLQEVVRIAVSEVFEADNSTTRELQPHQAYLMWLCIGVWSGFRRKTEIGISFLQPLVTMLFSSDAFTRFRYQEIVPATGDSDEQVNAKWRAWAAQESIKRLVIRVYIHDSQVAYIHGEQNRLISPAQMMLPAPASSALWQAPDAYVWRNMLLSGSSSAASPSSLPSMVELFANMPALDTLGDTVDKTLCILASCHALAHEVWQFRQQSQLLSSWQTQGRQDRWLGHLNRKKDLLNDLTTIGDYCELNDAIPAEVLFTVEFLTMCLHVSVEDILLFAGKSGEEEARRVYPKICAWSKDTESRAAIWSAGQVLRLARTFEETRLRDFYAVAVYQSTLTLWVYGMVMSHAARKSGYQTPDTGTPASTSQQLTGQNTRVYLDDTNSRSAKSFKLLGQGTPGIKSPLPSSSGTIDSYNFCSLRNHKGIMNVAEGILKSNFPGSRNGLPPLVENLANLMSDLGKLSGK